MNPNQANILLYTRQLEDASPSTCRMHIELHPSHRQADMTCNQQRAEQQLQVTIAA